MVARLLSGILASVFLPLGVIFSVIGLMADDVDRGEPEDFLDMGLPLGLLGLVLLAVFVVLVRRERARRARRRAGLRTTAEVVDARLAHNIRNRGEVQLKLTVRFPAAGTASATLFASPSARLEPGQAIDVLYDPDEPTNFEPVGLP